MSRLSLRSLVIVAAIALMGIALATAVRAATPAGYTWPGSGAQTPSATSDSSAGGSQWASSNAPAAAEGGPVNNNGQAVNGTVSVPVDGTGAADVEAPGEPADNVQELDYTGTIVSLDAPHSLFTLKSADGRTLTVSVSGQTTYGDGLSAAANLREGTSVSVEGVPQQGGGVAASEIKGTAESDAAGESNDTSSSSDTSSSND